MNPIQIKVKDNMLYIKWNDDRISDIKLANLRSSCPCAICTSEREEQGSKYIPIYTGDQITINEIKIIGNYAVGVIWKDGHNTGIYEFNYLIKLAS